MLMSAKFSSSSGEKSNQKEQHALRAEYARKIRRWRIGRSIRANGDLPAGSPQNEAGTAEDGGKRLGNFQVNIEVRAWNCWLLQG
jgi:hypothetical protein